MSWQVDYTLDYIRKNHPRASAVPLNGDAIRITMPERPDKVAIISAAEIINAQIASQYHMDFPDMDFLCAYRKEAVWEGEAIRYLESNTIGWGGASTLYSAISDGIFNTAAHKTYFFSYRLIRQQRSIRSLNREFDRVFTMTLTNGRTYRVGMVMEYEPTADVIRTFWERFGPIDIAWSINPNGNPTQNAIEAGAELGCQVMQWGALRAVLQNP